LNTLTGITNQIRINNDNIYKMTDEQIEKFAQRISELVIQGLEGDDDFIKNIEVYTQDDEEQSLLTDLATYMTQLDFNLQQENYTKCDELKKKIIKVEKQLNKFK
jgi:hypothetical protein